MCANTQNIAQELKQELNQTIVKIEQSIVEGEKSLCNYLYNHIKPKKHD